MSHNTTKELLDERFARTLSGTKSAAYIEREQFLKYLHENYPHIGLKEIYLGTKFHERLQNSCAMSEMDWTKKFVPMMNPRDGSQYFDPSEPLDAEFIKNMNENHLWTDFDLNLAFLPDIDEVRFPGRYKSNRAGHLVTMRPWSSEDGDLAVYCGDESFQC